MRNFVRSLMLLLALWLPVTASAAPIPVRGVVEGFYGTPWTQEQRLDMLAFMGKQGLNAYIYSPKDDVYARAKWREAYPEKQLAEIRALVQAADQAGVSFVYALSPGLDVHLSGASCASDRAAAEQKLEAMYACGVRSFAIFFDDIQDKDGAGQAAFCNALELSMRQKHPDVKAFYTVPTEYCYQDMVAADGQVKPYTQAFMRGLSKEIGVLYTGNGVVAPALTEADQQRAEKACGRPLGVWWNYPVSDYMESKLALGPVERLPKKGVETVFFNPMKYPELSKIALATGAAYAKTPESYRPQEAWHAAIQAQYGSLADDFERFADQSQHMENSWAKVGPADGRVMRQWMDGFWKAWAKASEPEPVPQDVLNQADSYRKALDTELAETESACRNLEEKLPTQNPEAWKECAPQIKQLQKLCEADRLGIRYLQAVRQGDVLQAKVLHGQLRYQQNALHASQKEACIAETTAMAFLDEVFEFDEKKANMIK